RNQCLNLFEQRPRERLTADNHLPPRLDVDAALDEQPGELVDPGIRSHRPGNLPADRHLARMCLPAHDPAMDGGAAAGEPRERTFLIADVRGYTRFTREHGDEAAARLAQAFAGLAYDSVEARGGRWAAARGDGALAVFPWPAAAVRAAAELIASCEEERPRAQSFRSSRAWDRGRRRWRAGRPLLRTRHGGAQGLRAACRADQGRRRS